MAKKFEISQPEVLVNNEFNAIWDRWINGIHYRFARLYQADGSYRLLAQRRDPRTGERGVTVHDFR